MISKNFLTTSILASVVLMSGCGQQDSSSTGTTGGDVPAEQSTTGTGTGVGTGTSVVGLGVAVAMVIRTWDK